ncbi:glutamyl-Q tRNA(Asp) synthetase [Gardnerella vaginalis]|uniref:glutamyl-Q tRNA(Asp) synthetase n=1 Tax=Gardnerella vaginalis TaxID=2702 RepID=UPI003970690E
MFSKSPIAIGRFAPTPSGRMHIGNMVAMLAAWLSAKSQGGSMILRLEDLDIARMPKDASARVIDDLKWAGLDWVGEPTYQHESTAIYQEALDALESLQDGDGNSLIYPCFCSRSDIRAIAAPQEGDGFIRYPGTCRNLRKNAQGLAQIEKRLQNNQQHSLRLAVPSADSREANIDFEDAIFGAQSFNIDRDLGDMVIRRADGVFSYQLAVVVDDVFSGVNDIVRGRDLLRSAALQIWIGELLEKSGFFAAHGVHYVQPKFAHLPLIDNAQGERLAKSKHSLDVGALREAGWSAERMIGYCMYLLGYKNPEQTRPVDMSAADALALFESDETPWDSVRANLADKSVPFLD